MNPTDYATFAALQSISIDGVAAVSTRRLAETVGRTRSTVAASLQRHIQRERIAKISGGRGVRMGRYRVLHLTTENQCKSRTTMTLVQEVAYVVPDLFRSRDLYGAGQLHSAAPKGVPLTLASIATLGVARSRRSINDQLTKLESLPAPLAISTADPGHRQRKLWTFQELTPEAESVILEHLELLAPRHRPRYRVEQAAQHLYEQAGYRWQLGLEPYSVIADRDILSHVIEDPFTGCLLYQGNLNNAGYGIAHADHFGIGVHRVVWIAERGPVDAGKELHHVCKQRACVNVDHLQVVTKAEHTAITWSQQLAA